MANGEVEHGEVEHAARTLGRTDSVTAAPAPVTIEATKRDAWEGSRAIEEEQRYATLDQRQAMSFRDFCVKLYSDLNLFFTCLSEQPCYPLAHTVI